MIDLECKKIYKLKRKLNSEIFTFDSLNTNDLYYIPNMLLIFSMEIYIDLIDEPIDNSIKINNIKLFSKNSRFTKNNI
jgi:hypothetical protein